MVWSIPNFSLGSPIILTNSPHYFVNVNKSMGIIRRIYALISRRKGLNSAICFGSINSNHNWDLVFYHIIKKIITSSVFTWFVATFQHCLQWVSNVNLNQYHCICVRQRVWKEERKRLVFLLCLKWKPYITKLFS